MATKKKVDWRIVVTALICISGIEIYALSQGINGTILSLVLCLIAGIAGYVIKPPISLK